MYAIRSYYVRIEEDLLGKNDRLARRNREAFAARGLFVLNLVVITSYSIHYTKLYESSWFR